jgi:hypothetical protein
MRGSRPHLLLLLQLPPLPHEPAAPAGAPAEEAQAHALSEDSNNAIKSVSAPSQATISREEQLHILILALKTAPRQVQLLHPCKRIAHTSAQLRHGNCSSCQHYTHPPAAAAFTLFVFLQTAAHLCCLLVWQVQLPQLLRCGAQQVVLAAQLVRVIVNVCRSMQ